VRCLARFIRDMRSHRRVREMRAASICEVLDKPADFVGQAYVDLTRACGEPDMIFSGDHGHWIAVWDGGKGRGLHAHVYEDRCLEITSGPAR
jgi:hypothetical protein